MKWQRILLRIPIIAFLIRKSKLWVIPGFQQLPIYDVVMFFIRQVNRVGLNERAAAISFNLIMALPASLLFLFSLIPYFPTANKMEMQILALFKDISPNSTTYFFIKDILDGLLDKHVGIFSFGFLLVVFYASNAMMGVIRTFDKSIEEKKGYFLHQRWRAIRLTLLLIILVVVSTFLLLLGKTQLLFLLKNVFHLKSSERVIWWNDFRWIIIILIVYFGIAFVYKYAPSLTKRWKLLSPGAILATALTLLTTLGFSYWVNNFASYDKVYGSIGTVLILMGLIYFNSLILLIGFELNVSITVLTKEATTRKLQEQQASA
ncbi:MAG: YihY/virulence factor BrkB family protein [Sediminibacterium sp.]|nr:YihY/virulence factor BrkB family protein [Sediminibacterium sp.]